MNAFATRRDMINGCIAEAPSDRTGRARRAGKVVAGTEPFHLREMRSSTGMRE
jgi:hypothetical protein